MISGLILLFGRSIEKGDLVTVDGQYTGYVESVGARSVSVRTPDNYDLVIPASDLVSRTVVNWTASDPWLRVHVPVRVSYNADIALVRQTLIGAAKRCPLVDTARAPHVWVAEFAESAVHLELLVWANGTRVTPAQMRGELLFEVWAALRAQGIEIPFPQRDLHLRSLNGVTLPADADSSETDQTSTREPATTGTRSQSS
jgi:potassium efflux system protein